MTENKIEEGNRIIAAEILSEKGYAIFNDGIIIGVKGSVRKNKVGTSGYLQINIGRGKNQKTYLVHRLVAEMYLSNPDDLPEVNHKDGNKLNNHVRNLEWCTRSANIKHGIDTGLIKKSMVGRSGKKHWRSKTVIRKLGDEVVTYESTGEAARLTGFDAHAIQDACAGRLKTYKGFTWKYKG